MNFLGRNGSQESILDLPLLRRKLNMICSNSTGKSSLAAALFRLVDASSGKIELDGIDISRVGLEDLRSNMSAIPQDPVLFAGTIRSNHYSLV